MFKEFLDDCDIVYNENECVYAFKRLDRDRDGNICYKDFNLFVLPK